MLVGDPKISTALPEVISSDEFAENVLGFEEVEEMEADEQEEMMQQEMMGSRMMYGGDGY